VRRISLTVPSIPLELWPSVATEGLSEHDKERFERIHEAMRLYFDGIGTSMIEEVTHVSRRQLSRLAKKCLASATDGQIYGFRALLPYMRTGAYQRQAGETPKRREQQGGQAGLLSALLRKMPDVEECLVTAIRLKAKRNNVAPAKLRPKDLHKIFIEYLEDKNVSKKDWPFNTKYKGLRSITTFMQSLLDKNFSRAVTRWEDRAAKAHLNVGTGGRAFLVFDEPYDVVEIDAYHIDSHVTVAFATPDGGETDLLLERLWLIAAVEARSSAVLAYDIVYRSEVAADDVLRVIRRAATEKWKPQENLLPGFRYGERAGLPSGMIEAAYGAQWSVTMLDGALAHLSTAIRERARKTLGFALNWGAVGHFERRPNVEHTFGQIAKDVFHRLPSTTGSNPFNGRADNAEEKAIRHKIRAEHIELLTDIYFAQHNATPSEGQYNRSPLEVLAYFLEGPNPVTTPRTLPKPTFDAAQTLACRESAVVRGGRKTGRRPYIQIDRVRYTSPVLADAGHLVGSRLIVDIDEEDMRQVRVFLSNGAELGYLTAHGKWSITKHSRRTRRAINSLLSRRALVLSQFDDPVLAYLAFLSTPVESGKKKQALSPRQTTNATRVAKEADAQLKIFKPPKPPKTKSIKDLSTKSSLIGAPIPLLGKVRNRS
jgi:putative transposase